MNLTDSEILKFQKGTPIVLNDICTIYPATIGQVVDLGYDKFQTYLSVITMTKPAEKQKDPELEELLQSVTDFQYVLLMSSMDVKINQLLKEAFEFFTHTTAMCVLDPPSIVLGDFVDQHILTEPVFYDLQRIIRRMYFLEVEGEEIIINEDDDPITKRIKMQLRASQEKVRRAKAAQAAQEKSDMKLSDLIGSMTINDCGLNILNIWDITYYAFHDQLKRMGWRDQFNINQKAALAGAKINKSQLKHWMRSIASSDK